MIVLMKTFLKFLSPSAFGSSTPSSSSSANSKTSTINRRIDFPICGAFFFSSRRWHTSWTGDWRSDVCSSDLLQHWSVPQDKDWFAYKFNGIEAQDAVATNLRKRRNVPIDPADIFLTNGATGALAITLGARSEERRVGKECRSRWAPEHEEKK